MTNPNGVRVGTIRWDAWYGGVAGDPGWYAQHNLDLPEYQARAPFFSTRVRSDLMSIAASATQASMDAEIAYAASVNNLFWVFARTKSPDPFQVPFDRFQASTVRTQINYCFRCSPNSQFYTEIANGTLISYMQQSNYERVLSGRPLLYLVVSSVVSSGDALVAALATFRTACTSAGLGNPYVGVIDLSTGFAGAYTTKNNIGADFISQYSTFGDGTANQTYASFDTATRAVWASMAALGAPIAPIASSGIVGRARIARPMPGSTSKPYVGLAISPNAPTPSELATHVQAAVDFVGANAGACPSKTLLMYAWNEFDEGGWLCPTWTGSTPDTSRVAALAGLL